jgi:hypothetical protein
MIWMMKFQGWTSVGNRSQPIDIWYVFVIFIFYDAFAIFAFYLYVWYFGGN